MKTRVRMDELEYPAEWNRGSAFHERLGEVIMTADCGWLQTVSAVGFLLGCTIASHEDEGYRTAVAAKICELVMGMARTGEVPGGMLQ
jgi:hypothetical protein